VMCWHFGAWITVRAKAFGYVVDDLFDTLEDHSTESYCSQAWSVRWRWQLFLQCEGQGRDEYSREHVCIS